MSADMGQSAVNCTLIPLRQRSILVPSSAIAEVLLLKQMDHAGSAIVWLAGTTLWNNETLLIVNPELFESSQSFTQFHNKNIVVVIKNPDESSDFTHLGILAHQPPKVIQTNRSNLSTDTTPSKPAKFAQNYVLVEQQTAYIPNIDQLFTYVSQQKLPFNN